MKLSNADMPAMPVLEEGNISSGMTKREMFAMYAMQAMLSNPEYSLSGFSHIAKMSVSASDALLTELEKTK